MAVLAPFRDSNCGRKKNQRRRSQPVVAAPERCGATHLLFSQYAHVFVSGSDDDDDNWDAIRDGLQCKFVISPTLQSQSTSQWSIELPTLMSRATQVVGIVLAITSGVLIGSSFVFKKKGLLRSQVGRTAGEGVAYLKSVRVFTQCHP